jgi:hypothetical protein
MRMNGMADVPSANVLFLATLPVSLDLETMAMAMLRASMEEEKVGRDPGIRREEPGRAKLETRSGCDRSWEGKYTSGSEKDIS